MLPHFLRSCNFCRNPIYLIVTDWLTKIFKFIVLILVLIPAEVSRPGSGPAGEFLILRNLITLSFQSNPTHFTFALKHYLQPRNPREDGPF